MIGAMDCNLRPKKINHATTLGAVTVAVAVFALSNLLFSGKYDALTDFGIEVSNTILQLLLI